MAGPLRIYNDTQNRILVESNVNNTPKPSFPGLVQGEKPTVQYFALDPTNGTQDEPFTYVGLSGGTVKLGIIAGSPTGGPDTCIAFQDTWTAISGGFQSTLDLNTVGISNALGNSATLECTAEIEVTESGGYPVKYFQGPCTIRAAVIDTLSTIPTPASSYYTVNEANARFLKKVEDAGICFRSVSPDGTKAIDIGCNNDGTQRIDAINLS